MVYPSEPKASAEPDYRIVEYFDTDLLRVRFGIRKSENIRGAEVTQRFDSLEEARKIVLMLRKYKNCIFHLVDAEDTTTPEQVKKANTARHAEDAFIGSSSPSPISAPLLPNPLPVTWQLLRSPLDTEVVEINAADFCVMVDTLRVWLGSTSFCFSTQRKETLDRMIPLLKQVESRCAEKVQ